MNQTPPAEAADAFEDNLREKHAVRPGVRLAVDVGMVRVGVARSDSEGIMALPVATYRREENDFSGVLALLELHNILEIYVGLPLNMDGTEGASAKAARRWATRLARMIAKNFFGFGPEIRLVDERLSSVTAHQQLSQSGMRHINHRTVVDQQAAVVILESALEIERNTGEAPGKALS